MKAGSNYAAGRADDRAAVARWLLSEAETSERCGDAASARALLRAANVVLRADHLR